jgi:hypothetical protein
MFFYNLKESYLINKNETQSLPDFLEEVIFNGNTGEEISPLKEDVEGFNKYIEAYKADLVIEHAAVASHKG